jgi:hypothetical protein
VVLLDFGHLWITIIALVSRWVLTVLVPLAFRRLLWRRPR